MRKLTYLLTFVIVLLLGFGFMKVNQQDPNADESPALQTESVFNTQQDTTPPAGFPFPTLWNFNFASVPNMNAGTVGALVLFDKFYFNRWNLTSCYRYDNSGPNGGPGTQISPDLTYVGSCRDLTTDGRYIYGGQASSTLYKFDTNMTIVGTKVLSGGQCRAVAWDPNRHGFWNTNFSGSIYCHDTNGVLIQTIPSTLAGKYGAGFDSTTSIDTAWLWIWDQTSTSTNGLYKYHCATGQLKATYIFNLVGTSGTAGGAEVEEYQGDLVLLLDYQNYAMNGYRMKTLVGIINQQNSGIRDFKLNHNYPNPFNPVTTISFQITKAGNVTLEVFDVSGKLVKTLINQYMNAMEREQKLVFDASNLPSGTYFYRLTNGGNSETKKMVLIK
jgi:hypothetical protein